MLVHVRNWRQTILEEGRTLTASCVMDGQSTLKLKTGESLRDFEPFHLTILSGALTAEDRRKYRLLEEARGGLWFREGEYLDGWLRIGSESFEALWTQILSGVAGTWTINMMVEPVENDTWMDRSVSITFATFQFDVAVQSSPFEQQENSSPKPIR